MTTIQEHVSLAPYTTLRIGGRTRRFCEPDSTEAMLWCLQTARDNGWAALILGRGSNMLISDDGFAGLVIHTGKLRSITLDNGIITAGCGASLPELSAKTCAAGWQGLEWAGGIPGSLGGAIVMNAGAYGGEISSIVQTVTVWDGTALRNISDHGFSYRHSVYLSHPEWVILSATLHLTPGDPAELQETVRNNLEARRQKQPVHLPSAGSFFKRPPGHYASALIDQCGLGGLTVGGAQVSEQHKGFVVNIGGATCADVLTLARTVRAQVYTQTGVTLEPEVQLVGDIQWNF